MICILHFSQANKRREEKRTIFDMFLHFLYANKTCERRENDNFLHFCTFFCVQKRGKMTIFVYFALFACKKGKRREDDNFSDACT